MTSRRPSRKHSKPSPAGTPAKAYASAGVDVDLGNAVKQGIHALVASTHTPSVLGKIGGFGGLFRADFKGMREPVLVSSVDGVGTKLKIAFLAGRHDTVGQDLVNHCINDIAVVGARPLFFLDYLATASLDPDVFRQILKGFAKACREGGCALIGGETAQMPGIYSEGEYDVAGCIVGVAERSRIPDGSKVRKGDGVIGIPSNGLHTNGYSLARKILLETMGLSLKDFVPGTKRSLGAELLRVHRNYQPLLASLPPGAIRGAAHITGGGLVDNLPRVLPPSMDAVIDARAWKVPRIFEVLRDGGGVDAMEMFQVFNMGIGMALIVAEKEIEGIVGQTGGRLIGRVTAGSGRVRMVL